MRKGATTALDELAATVAIVAQRNEKGSYNTIWGSYSLIKIVALRNEKGSYNVCGC